MEEQPIIRTDYEDVIYHFKHRIRFYELQNDFYMSEKIEDEMMKYIEDNKELLLK